MWSHTQEVKAELSRLPVGSAASAAAELAGMWAVAERDGGLPLTSALVARRAYRLARRAGAEPVLVTGARNGRRVARLVFRRPAALPRPADVRNVRAYLRGAFLARGYVADPERMYHLEIVIGSEAVAMSITERLAAVHIDASITQRRGQWVLYIKSQDQVGRFLVYLGAHNARLGLESLLVMRAVKNRVNRLVNGEAANLRRTAVSGVEQQEAMARLMRGPDWNGLPESLRQLAVLRARHPDWNLRELGRALNPPLSKSGVAHRLRRLMSLAAADAGPVGGGHTRGRRV